LGPAEVSWSLDGLGVVWIITVLGILVCGALFALFRH